jgi:3-oxoacyl-[acyl-carrier protein] reductase
LSPAVTSSSVRSPVTGFAAYASSKSAALATTAILAVELGAHGITANSVMSGAVAAGIMDPDSEFVRAAPEGVYEAIAAAAPMGRMGRPSDIAAVAAFLATPEAGWVNGQTILVDNGAAA